MPKLSGRLSKALGPMKKTEIAIMSIEKSTTIALLITVESQPRIGQATAKEKAMAAKPRPVS